MEKEPPLRAELNRNFKRWPSKRVAAFHDRLARMPDTHEASDDLDSALVYSKADPRWKRINDAILAELDSRARGARNSSKGAAGQGKVRGPKR